MKRRQKGQSLVEFALVLPILLIIISGIVDLGRAMFLWSNLSNAAREGSRYGAANPGDTLGIITAARAKIVSMPADDVHVAISYDDGVFGHDVSYSETIPGDYRVVVTPSYDFHPFTPFINRILPGLTINFVSARTIVGSGGMAPPWQDSAPTFPPQPTLTFTPTPSPNPEGDIWFTTSNLTVCVWQSFTLSNYVQTVPVGVDYNFYYETQTSPVANWHLDDFNAHQSVLVEPDDLNGGNEGLGRYRVFAIVPETGQTDSILIQIADCGYAPPPPDEPTSTPTMTPPAQCSGIAASEMTIHGDEELRVSLANNNDNGKEKITRIVFNWPTSDNYPDMRVKEFKLDNNKLWDDGSNSPPTDVTLSGDDHHREIEHGHTATWKAKMDHGPKPLTDLFNLSSFSVTIYFEGGCAVSSTGSSDFGPEPTPPPTNTPESPPVPTTSPQCADLSASQLVTVSGNTDHLQTTISNGTDDDAELERIVFTWPNSGYPNMKVDWFKLGGDKIWNGDSHSSPTDVSNFTGDRMIRKNNSKVWEMDFDSGPIDLASAFNMSDFMVTFYFVGGCSVSTSGSGGSEGPTATPEGGATATPSGPATHTPTPGASQEICYVSDNPAYPGQGPQYFYTQIHVTDLGSSLQVQLVLDKEFVDNTYGANTSEYWKNGQLKQHTFQDLWKSDRAQFLFYAVGNSSPVMDISVDYLDVDGGAPSGYASQGVTGGDGSVNVGSAAWVLSSSTSLDYNLNSAAYPNMTVDSPVTGANYTPNASYPNWIFDVIYTVVVDKAAFGSAGYDYVTIPYIHASPSRVGQNTVSVQPGPCVPYPTATATTQSGPPPTATSAAATPTSVAPTPNPTGDICYVSTNPDPQHGPGQLYTTLTVSDLGNSLQVRLTLDPNFVDNTYGANSSDYWKKGSLKQHTFQDLYKSDRAEFLLYDGQNQNVIDLFLDYIEADGTSHGVTGGDGSVAIGQASWVLSYDTSMAANLRSYPGMTTDSPAPGDPSYPNWDFTVWYEVEILKSAFDPAGYGGVTIPYIHASPSKVGQNSVNVTPGPCIPPAATSTPVP